MAPKPLVVLCSMVIVFGWLSSQGQSLQQENTRNQGFFELFLEEEWRYCDATPIECNKPEDIAACDLQLKDSQCAKFEGSNTGYGCQCPDQNFADCATISHQCVKFTSEVGGYCRAQENCELLVEDGDLDLVECNSQDKCECVVAIAVPHPDDTKCLLKAVNETDPCEHHVQCMDLNMGNGESFCDKGQCWCATTSVNVNGKCYRLADDNQSPCEHDEQCKNLNMGEEGDIFCDKDGENVCKCNMQLDGSVVESGGKCYRKASSLDDDCFVPLQCEHFGGDDSTLTDCIKEEGAEKGVCKCVSTLAVPHNNNQCLKKSLHRGSCTIDAQCEDLLYAQCFSNAFCLCIDEVSQGSYLSPDDSKCYKYAENLQEPCTEPHQCYPLNGVPGNDLVECLPISETDPTTFCQCNQTIAISKDNKCWATIGSGDNTIPCNHQEQCQIENAECADFEGGEKRCLCTNLYVDNDVDELKVDCQQIRDTENTNCTGHPQCTAGMGQAECRFPQAVCKCSGSTVFLPSGQYGDKCFEPSYLNDTSFCTKEGQCLVGVGPNSVCNPQTNKCSCVNNAISYQGRCYMNKIVGSDCNDNDLECSVPISGEVICSPRTKKCECKVGYQQDFGGTTCRNGSGRLAFNFTILILVLGKMLF